MQDVTFEFIDGIVVAKFKPNLVITVDLAEKMVKARLALQKGHSYPLLIHSNGFKIDSKNARNFMKDKGLEGMKAGVFLVKNSYERVIGNFFLKVNPPPIPAKLFSDERKALEWLKKYR